MELGLLNKLTVADSQMIAPLQADFVHKSFMGVCIRLIWLGYLTHTRSKCEFGGVIGV